MCRKSKERQESRKLQLNFLFEKQIQYQTLQEVIDTSFFPLINLFRISNIIIQIMSKKPQPQKAENPKNKIEIVDQQNDPFLRALQKKVRNINKKLTEISQLEGKQNLKPEQIQKINRREALIDQRTRIEQNATFFKQVYAENAAHYRNHQLKELEILARAISVYHTAPQIPEQARLSNLWRALQQHDNHINVNTAILSLSNTLKEFANDRKLQKALTTYVQKHGNDEIKHVQINQEKIVNDILAEKPEKQEVKVEEPSVKVEKVVPPQPQVTVVQTKPEAPAVVVPQVPQVTQVTVQQETTPIVQQQTVAQPASEQAQTVAGEKKQGQKRDYRNRDNRDKPYRGKGTNYRGNNRKEVEGERRQYKPKYEQKRGEQRQAEESGSSDSDEQVRQFRREQIKKLEDDGFTVVGKPKPKTKDVREQQGTHDRQHGKKNHHHHKAENH